MEKFSELKNMILKRGIVHSSGCVRPMVSHRTKPEARGKERKVRSVNGRTEQQGEKGVLLLEGKDLDTGEGIPINPVPS